MVTFWSTKVNKRELSASAVVALPGPAPPAFRSASSQSIPSGTDNRVDSERWSSWTPLTRRALLYVLQPLAYPGSHYIRDHQGPKTHSDFFSWMKRTKEFAKSGAKKTNRKRSFVWYLFEKLVLVLLSICLEFFRCKNPAAFVSTFLSRWHKLVPLPLPHLFIFSFCTTAPEPLPGHFCRMLHCMGISSRLPATLPWCWGAISLKAANCVFVLCSEMSKWMSEAGKGPGYQQPANAALTVNLGVESVPSVTSQGDDLGERKEVQDRLWDRLLMEHIGKVYFARIWEFKLRMKTCSER